MYLRPIKLIMLALALSALAGWHSGPKSPGLLGVADDVDPRLL
jgi:hypothetical protein